MLLIINNNNNKTCRAGPNFKPCGACKISQTHYCKVCKKHDVTHRSFNCPKRIKKFKLCRAGPNFKPCGACKIGQTHYCKVCKKHDVTHRSFNCPKRIKNATVLCFSMNKKNIYMVYEKNYKCWVTPGGRMNSKDKGKIFNCARREWEEEVGCFLPNCVKKNNLRGFEYFDSKDTRLYYGYTNDNIKYTYNPKGETLKGKWFNISDVINGNIIVRNCVRRSLIDLINNVGI